MGVIQSVRRSPSGGSEKVLACGTLREHKIAIRVGKLGMIWQESRQTRCGRQIGWRVWRLGYLAHIDDRMSASWRLYPWLLQSRSWGHLKISVWSDRPLWSTSSCLQNRHSPWGDRLKESWAKGDLEYDKLSSRNRRAGLYSGKSFLCKLNIVS